MFKRTAAMMLTLSLLLIIAFSTAAADLQPQERRDWGLGWQYTRPSSGLSLKIPIGKVYYFQPIFAFGMSENETNTNGNFAVGLRGIYELTPKYNFQPYVGIGVGHFEKFKGTSVEESTIEKGGTGSEIFFGVEYGKYLVRPSLEIGMGSLAKNDGSFLAGVIYNFSVLYYF